MKITVISAWDDHGHLKIQADIIEDCGKVIATGMSYDNPHYSKGPIKATAEVAVSRALDDLENKLVDARRAAQRAGLVK